MFAAVEKMFAQKEMFFVTKSFLIFYLQINVHVLGTMAPYYATEPQNAGSMDVVPSDVPDGTTISSCRPSLFLLSK